MWARLGVGGNRGGCAHSRSAHGTQPRTSKNKHNQEHKSTPRCTLLRGPSCEGNTPTAALAYSLYISSVTSTERSLSCMKNNGGSSRKKMELGGNDAGCCRSLSLEKVVAHLYTNRITILPLAAGDNGMDKRNKTSTGHCHSVQPIVSLSFPL